MIDLLALCAFNANYAHVIDSDWGFVLVEPWGKARTDAFFLAASPAFKEPFTRHLSGRAALAVIGCYQNPRAAIAKMGERGKK